MKLPCRARIVFLIPGFALIMASGFARTTAANEPPDAIMKQVVDPEDPKLREFKEFRKKQLALEKDLKKLRGKYFANTNNAALRSDGILKLRTYRDDWMYQSLIAVFQEQADDVRDGLLEIFTSAKSDAGDRGLMWLAIAHPKAAWRSAAIESLSHRVNESGRPTRAMVDVASNAVNSGDQAVIASAGEAGAALNIFEIIPLLIQAGGGGGPGPGGSYPDTQHKRPLAWIAFATQTAYVSNLRPAAGQGTIGFDPTISVVNSGNLLVINDAVVSQAPPRIVYRPLASLGSALTGQPAEDLAKMGTDAASWKQWYASIGGPALAKREAAFAKAAADKIAAGKAAAEKAVTDMKPAPARDAMPAPK